MSDTIAVKLARNIINIHIPALQTVGSTHSFSGSTRITRADNTRVTRGGNTRVTRDFTATEYPELTIVKIPNNIIPILLESN